MEKVESLVGHGYLFWYVSTSASLNSIYVPIQEGLFTFLFGIISFFGLPRSPAHAHFLSDKERSYVFEKLKTAGAISKDERTDEFRWGEIVKSIQSPQVWLLSIISFFGGASSILLFSNRAAIRKQGHLSLVLHSELLRSDGSIC